MTLKFKTIYLDAVRERYYNSSKKQKTIILNELCAITGYSRKWAIKIMAIGHMKGKKASGRTKQYSNEAVIHLRRLWHIMGRMNSKKMVAAFPTWLNYYQAEGFNQVIKDEILSMSHATVDRYLASYRKQFARRKRTGTRKSKTFLNAIPIKDFTSRSSSPGYLQADTVAHCGNSLSGTFVWTLTVTDEYTGWTENRAVYGKNGATVGAALFAIIKHLPFSCVQLNTDSGTEFMNDSVQNIVEKSCGLRLTRSRTYRKNDNCHVEQKNFTHVREIFGYERFDKGELELVMNEIYKNYFNLLSNFFIPQQKCIRVERVGSRYRRFFDTPKTPYERVMESKDLTLYQRTKLVEVFGSLNPILLRKELNQQLKRFHRIREGKSDYKYRYAA